MIKPKKLNKGDKVAIISLSSGTLGEPFMVYQKDLIEKRLNEFGLEVVFTPNSLKGREFIEKNPQARAEDLKWAFRDESIKGVICAIGGIDTYKTVPFLLDDESFINNVRNNPKVFIGYSDTTSNHLMFHRIGLTTYYGHSAIVDFGELANEMLPYSKEWFKKLFEDNESLEIKSSPTWYLERTSFDESEHGKDRISKAEEYGYEVLSGNGVVKGELFGGCIESLSDLITGDSYVDAPQVNAKYKLIPSSEELKGKILFLETSEEQPNPERLRYIVTVLDNYGVFKTINAVLIGKPQDEAYYDEYKKVYTDIIGKYNIPVLFNINFGHAHPKCILPYGVEATIDCDNKRVIINESLVN
jgi:muramoyltetrapeptide carboxypeptidase LdcA involved in peptidoglycan recycling